MRVERLMHDGDAPVVRLDTPLPEALDEMTAKKLGMTCVVDAEGRLAGIITDGDVRRHMTAASARTLLDRTAGDVMTRNPVTVGRATLAVEAIRILEQRKITSIVVVDDDRRVQGVVHLHDLWRTQLF